MGRCYLHLRWYFIIVNTLDSVCFTIMYFRLHVREKRHWFRFENWCDHKLLDNLVGSCLRMELLLFHKIAIHFAFYTGSNYMSLGKSSQY